MVTRFQSIEFVKDGVLLKTKIGNTFPVELFFSKTDKTLSRISIKIGHLVMDDNTVLASSVKLSDLLRTIAKDIDTAAEYAIELETHFK